MVAEVQTHDYSFYVCPSYKGYLTYNPQALCCPVCSREYPLVAGIPDFLAPQRGQAPDGEMESINRVDRGYLKRFSGLYESRLWYPW